MNEGWVYKLSPNKTNWERIFTAPFPLNWISILELSFGPGIIVAGGTSSQGGVYYSEGDEFKSILKTTGRVEECAASAYDYSNAGTYYVACAVCANKTKSSIFSTYFDIGI